MTYKEFFQREMGRSLHIITDLDCGGAEAMLVRLCSQAETASIAVLCLKPKGVHAKKIESLGIPVYSLDLSSPLLLPRHIKRLANIIAEVEPELYWGWMYHGALFSILAMCVKRKPVVWNFRQTFYGLSRERLFTRLVVLVLRCLSFVPKVTVYNAQESYKQHRAFGFTGESCVIPNGFPVEEFFYSDRLREQARQKYTVPADAVVIGHAARFHPMKAHDSFFRLMKEVLLGHPECYVLCCGHGVNESLLPQGFPIERIRFLGVETSMNHFYNALDIFCCSSAWGEGFPNVVAEALLVGLPCVATDVGAMRELLGDKGKIVPPGDAVALKNAIEKTVLQVSGNSTEERQLRRSQIEERYSIDTVAKEYQRIEQSVNFQVS